MKVFRNTTSRYGIKKLDIVLNYFKDNPSPVFIDEVLGYFKEKHNIGLTELSKIFKKIHDDGHLDKLTQNSGSDKYVISFNGSLFKGYINQGRAIRRKLIVLSIREWLLVCGTVLAGSYGLFEVVKWLYHHEHWKLPF